MFLKGDAYFRARENKFGPCTKTTTLIFFVAAHKIILFVSLIFLFLCSTFLYETNEYQSLLIPWNKNAKVFLLCFYLKFKWCLLCASIIVILPFYQNFLIGITILIQMMSYYNSLFFILQVRTHKRTNIFLQKFYIS